MKTLALSLLCSFPIAALTGRAQTPQSPPPAPAPAYLVSPAAARGDAAGGLRELAALASFPFSIRSALNGEASTPELNLGASFHRPYEPWQAEMCARVNRLAHAEDSGLAEAAARFEPLLHAGYQFQWVNADFGNTPENAAKLSAKVINRGFDFVRSFVADQARSESKFVNGPDGRTYYVEGEPFHLSTDTKDALGDFQQTHGDMMKTVQGQALFSGLVEMNRGRLQREAMTIWETTLFPRLVALGEKKPVEGLVEAGPMAQFPGPMSLRAMWQYGMVTFGNPRLPLKNVVVRVKLQNETEDTATAYAFLPSLAPGQYVQLDVPSDFAPLARFSRKVQATFTLVCDQGTVPERTLDLGAPRGTPPQTVAETKAQLVKFRKQADDLRRQVPKLYPVGTAQPAYARLLATAGTGANFAGVSRGEAYLLQCSPFTQSTPVITAKLIIGQGSVTAVTPLEGRLLGEVGRGAVIAFRIVKPGASAPLIVSSSRAPGVAAPAGRVPRATSASVPFAPPPASPPVAANSLGKSSLGGGSLGGRGTLGPSRGLESSGGLGAGGKMKTDTVRPATAAGHALDRPAEPGHSPGRGADEITPAPNLPARLLSAPAEIADFTVFRSRKTANDHNPMLLRLFTGDLGSGMDLAYHSQENTVNADYVLSVDAQDHLWLQTPADEEGHVTQIPLGTAKERK